MLFRLDGNERYSLGTVHKMPSKHWSIVNRCVVWSDDTLFRVPLDNAVLVDELMLSKHGGAPFNSPLLRSSLRGFSVTKAFVLNALTESIPGAISVDIHTHMTAIAAWQRTIASIFIHFVLTMATFAVFYMVWGYGSNQCANVPNIVLTSTATHELFGIRLAADEEFVISEDNALLFPNMPFRRGSVVKARLPLRPR